MNNCFENNELIEYRFSRVVMGTTSLPFLLSETLNKHIKSHAENAQFAEKVLDSIHVDDLTAGEESESKAYTLYENCKQTLKKASFDLRKFKSNSKVLESWIVKDYGQNELEIGESTEVLGIS